jgi:RNA polymerase-binding transcription factor DksA
MRLQRTIREIAYMRLAARRHCGVTIRGNHDSLPCAYQVKSMDLWRMVMSQQRVDFADIAKRLRARRDELSGRLSAVRADQRRAQEPLSLDSSDRATQRENDEVIDAIGLTAESELIEIDKALARIEAGIYGTCLSCGSPINVSRLLAIPYAERCSDCAQDLRI